MPGNPRASVPRRPGASGSAPWQVGKLGPPAVARGLGSHRGSDARAPAAHNVVDRTDAGIDQWQFRTDRTIARSGIESDIEERATRWQYPLCGCRLHCEPIEMVSWQPLDDLVGCPFGSERDSRRAGLESLCERPCCRERIATGHRSSSCRPPPRTEATGGSACPGPGPSTRETAWSSTWGAGCKGSCETTCPSRLRARRHQPTAGTKTRAVFAGGAPPNTLLMGVAAVRHARALGRVHCDANTPPGLGPSVRYPQRWTRASSGG